MCLEQNFLEAQYNFYRSSMFQKTFREHDAVELYRMKNVDDFNAHVSVIPYRFCTYSVLVSLFVSMNMLLL
jgi:hypothetical protein